MTTTTQPPVAVGQKVSAPYLDEHNGQQMRDAYVTSVHPLRGGGWEVVVTTCEARTTSYRIAAE